MFFNFFNDNNNIKKIILLLFISSIIYLILFPIVIYAESNQNNVFDNVYSIDEYTTIQDLLDDSGYAPHVDVVNSFLQDKSYKNKYIISYCNSGDCDSLSTNRSIDLIGFNNDVDIDFIQNDRHLTIKFTGKPDAMVYLYDYSQIWANSYTASLEFINYTKEYNSFRSVVPVSAFFSVDDRLGSLVVDNVFVKLNYYVLPLIYVVLSFLAILILMFWGVPKVLKFFRHLTR